MRVLVVGAYGLIGSAVAARLIGDGWEVVGAGRDLAAARRRMPQLDWRLADLATMRAEDWRPLLEGCDAVITCAGALQDSPRDDLAAVHVRGLAALGQACVAAGVRRLVHVSAAGVAASPGPFGATKRAGEAALAGIDLDWIVLRPGLVLGPSAYGGSALLRGLAAFPLAIPAVRPEAVVQTVWLGDVAEAASRALAPDAPVRRVYDIVSPEAAPVGRTLQALRGWLGLPPAPVAAVPAWIGALAGRSADALAWLGWRSPMRTTSLRQLAAGVRGRADEAVPLLGRQPMSLAEALARHPAGVQERWFAKLYFVKPLGLAVLAGFWLASGLVGLIRQATAAAVLTEVGMAEPLARGLVLGGAAADLALAGLVCARRTAPFALVGMVAVSAAYLAGATLFRPDLWADPLGPLVKVVPAAVLALACLAMMDER